MEEESNAVFGVIYADKPVFELAESKVVYTVNIGPGNQLNQAQIQMWFAQISADALSFTQSRRNEIFAIDFEQSNISVEGNLAKVPVTFYNYLNPPQPGIGVTNSPFSSGVSDYCQGAKRVQERFNRHYSQKPGAIYSFRRVSSFMVSGESENTNGPCGRHHLYNWFCYGHGANTNYLSSLTASQLEYLYAGQVDNNGPNGGTLNAFYEKLGFEYNGEKVLLEMRCTASR
ncbi:MAG TPA: hypothetical protein VFV37_02135 [Luteibaculaceae bacterium]|nr:hypothetical protein [Luteibaculaceae bacterium]